MAQKENDMLAGLEHLLDEFYSPSTTNERKRNIEQQLNEFSLQRDSWKLCINFLKHSTNPFVSMYTLYQLENVISRQWNLLDASEQHYLKQSVNEFTFALNSTMPNFIRNKVAKVSVEIAKHTWPKYYMEHYSVIMQLLHNEHAQLLGLILLRTTSEEILCPSSHVSSNYKEALMTFCTEHIPQIFQILTEILDSLIHKKRHYATATPPPSPTHPTQAPVLAQQISAASFRPDSKEIGREALAILQHLFSWVDLVIVPHYALYTIFKFTNTSSYAQADDDMCFLAMTVINELLYRKCAPPATHQLFMELYQHTALLLRDISLPTLKVEAMGAAFVDKLCEMLSLLVGQHLWRLEMQASFTAVEFLGNLFALTFQLPTIEGYLRCLTVWTTFIKQIKPQNAHKYSQPLVALVMTVLAKMQFTNNAAQLEKINDTDPNEDNETDWQIYQNACIEIIALVAEFAPMDTFDQVLAPWRTANDVYATLRTMDVTHGTLKLVPSESQRLHCILKDLATLTQTLARLSSNFMDQGAEYYKTSIPTIQGLLAKLIESAALSSAVGFYHLKTCDSRLASDFTEVHCQLLAALKTWCTWYKWNTSNKLKDLNPLLLLVLPHVRAPQAVPAKVTLSAAHFLFSITSAIHPPELMQIPDALGLIQVASTLPYPKNQSRDVVLCALATVLLKPWGELCTSDAQARNNLIQSLFEAISHDYRQINEYCGDARSCLDITEQCLPCFVNIMDYCKEYPVISKKYLYVALKPTIDHTVDVFSGFSKYPMVVELQLQFFIKVLEVLQQQMSIAAIRKAVDVFLAAAVREQQQNQFGGLDMLLKILQLVIESPGSAYKNFMEGIFELCMKNIYPALIQQANEYPDAIIALINLLHSVLLNRWNCFYVSQIRLGNSPGCSDVEPAADSPQQLEQVIQVLEVFGRCLLQSDINIFRVSLGALENLNVKWKLYHKALFKEQMLGQFLNVLLQTMLDRTHHLLNEDIMHAFYNMAAVSFSQFFDRFLTQYIDNLDRLTGHQRNTLRNNFSHSTDMPTFVLNLQRFVDDARCFIMCNSSLPPGSVVF